MPDPTPVTVFLFTDIEGSTRLWERAPEAMREALARHDAIAAASVESNGGRVVKTTGDGVHAVFHDPLDAVKSAIAMQVALGAAEGDDTIKLRVRAGLHVGVEDERGNDFYGTSVNRAARIMSAAHGGQVLVSDAVASLLRDRLPVDICLRPLGRVRLRDLSEPEAVHQVEHPELRTQFPALRSLESTPNNLPHALTSFIGREKELEETRHLLAQTRLLTLVGIGGLGKSRLSLQLAREVMGDYLDGVWLVELAPISDPQVVPHAVATVLGVKEDAGSGIVLALRRFTADRELLLILDNCEHLAAACAQLARELLEAGANVRIVASSRERLNIRGETVYPVAPLATPAKGSDFTREALLSFSAARLFIERASAVTPSFAITGDNAMAIADVCQRLDGIPLALELAAARMSSMSLSTIVSRLDDRFRLLRRGDRTALPRQQTLRALIDWSYELLDERERTSFARLSVFAGSFTLAAAEAVLPCALLEKDDVVDVVTELAEKSLVAVDADGERYRMLDTVREYAEHMLAASDEDKATRTRHLEYYVGLVESIRPALTGPDQGIWLARLDLEIENVLVAHRYCDTCDDGAALGLRLVSSLMLYWTYRGKFELGHRLTIEALARPAATTHDLSRCRALFRAGQFALFTGEYDEAGRYLRESLEISRVLEEPAATSAVLAQLAVAAIRQASPQTARAYLDESRALANKLGDKRKLAAALNETGQLDRLEGDLTAAGHNYKAALALAKEIDDRESIAVTLLNLAMVELSSHAPQAAARTLNDVRNIVHEIGSRHTAQTLFEVTAVLASKQEMWHSAARLFLAAQTLSAETGLHVHPADDDFLTPVMREARARVSNGAWEQMASRTPDFDQAMREVAQVVSAPARDA